MVPFADRSTIERRVLAVAERIAPLLSPRDTDAIRNYARVGEYGVAVDLLVSTLAANRLPVPDDEFSEVLSLASDMGVEERWVGELHSESSGHSAMGTGVYRSRQFPGFPNSSLFAGTWSADDVAEGARRVLGEVRGAEGALVRGEMLLIHGAHTSRTISPRRAEIGVLVNRAADKIIAAYPRVRPPQEFLRPEPIYFKDLRAEVLAFIEQIAARLPLEDVEAAKELALVAGEYGFAVEWVAATVRDCGVRLSGDEAERFARLVFKLGLERA